MTDTTAGNPAGPTRKTRKMEVFQGEGVELGHDVMPLEGVDEGVMAGFAKLTESGAATVESQKVRCLFREPCEGGFSLCRAWFKSGFVLPRHSHSADCLYYVVGGSLKMGARTLRRGDGVFVPADKAYTFEAGPEGVEVLEFRNATHFNMRFVGNDDAHWEHMAAAYRDNANAWANETIPPTERARRE